MCSFEDKLGNISICLEVFWFSFWLYENDEVNVVV